MNDLTKYNGSVADRLKQKIASRGGFGPRSTCLLLDVSGSMGGQPILKLRELAQQLNKFRRFEFSDDCVELLPHEKIRNADQGTKMGHAFRYIKKHGITHTVIITDGQPDSEHDALTAAVGLKIDILYVGPDPAPPFLEKLAKMSGGKYGEATLDSLKELENTVRGLLPAPSSPIEL